MTSAVGKCGAETFNLISTRGFRRVGFILLDKVTHKVGVIRQRSRWEALDAPLLSLCSCSKSLWLISCFGTEQIRTNKFNVCRFYYARHCIRLESKGTSSYSREQASNLYISPVWRHGCELSSPHPKRTWNCLSNDQNSSMISQS